MQPVLKGVAEVKPAPRPDGLLVDNGEYFFTEFPPGQAVASLDLSSGDALTDFLNNNRSTDGVDTSVKPLPPGGAMAPQDSPVQPPLMPIPVPRADNAPAASPQAPAMPASGADPDPAGARASAVNSPGSVTARPL
ncbi:hypothetical protein D3C71_1793150 [compost metagenome]